MIMTTNVMMIMLKRNGDDDGEKGNDNRNDVVQVIIYEGQNSTF